MTDLRKLKEDLKEKESNRVQLSWKDVVRGNKTYHFEIDVLTIDMLGSLFEHYANEGYVYQVTINCSSSRNKSEPLGLWERQNHDKTTERFFKDSEGVFNFIVKYMSKWGLE